MHSQLGQPGNTWTNQQSPQQIQFFSGLQAQQRQGYQNYQASQGQRQQGPSDFNNQLRPIFNPSMPNSAITSARVPPSIQMGNSSYTQGPRPHQGIGLRMPNNYNMPNPPTTFVRAPSNVQMNSSSYVQGPPTLGRGNQMIGTPHHGTTQHRPRNSLTIPFNHPEVNNEGDDQWIYTVFDENV